MKLRRIYTNQPNVFPDIDFRDGLNVIYAEVRDPGDREKDSHNLGKSLLIQIVDFLLLKGWDASLFLHEHKDLFRDFVFYLQIEDPKGSGITIRRAISGNTKIWLMEHGAERHDFRDTAKDEWTYSPPSFEKAREQLNSLLELTDLSPWSYRKGVGYFLRTQDDYRDVFQLARFAAGRHREWKPFMTHLLGFDYKPIEAKYDAEDGLAELESARENIARFLDTKPGEYDRLKGAIQIAQQELTSATERINRFSFFQEELELNERLVRDTERQVAQANERLYTIDYERGKLEEALEHRETFDLGQVRQIFQEAQIALPSELVRSYEELLDFNRRITSDRAGRLDDQLLALDTERELLITELQRLDTERSSALSILRQHDTLAKFRELQTHVVERQAEVVRLEAELEQLVSLSGISREIRLVKDRIRDLAVEIEEVINEGNPRYERLRLAFHDIVRRILAVPAIISISVNDQGNPEFDASVLQGDLADVKTSEDRGFSYRRLLCMAFDLALLGAYEDGDFFRFVYHDGALEALDDRKKLQLLDVVRHYIRTYDIQYIMTVIDADLPHDPEGKKLSFREEEVVRRLHDRGKDGRLFRMAKF
jgi:uncharacterized protein YydD (DUF2326 family)